MSRELLARANEIRRCLTRLRRLAYTARCCPMPALEMLIAEMLAIHYCSDRDECLAAGMDGYLTKPVRQQELYDAIHAVFGARARRTYSRPLESIQAG